MESCLTYLEGSRTRARYDADRFQSLDPVDAAPLLARYDLGRVARTLNPRALAERSGPGLWRWSELLPVRGRHNQTYLGEGATPLLGAARLGGALGLDRMLVKAEGLNPGGGWSARGIAVAVSRAKDLGATSLVAAAAGREAAMLGSYGAAAGLTCTVVLPRDVPPGVIAAAQLSGATVLTVDGTVTDAQRLAVEIAGVLGAADLSSFAEPYRLEGAKTLGLELVEQLGWGVPDVLVMASGDGSAPAGLWKAFDELEALGMLGSGRPRMVLAQPEGCAPLVRAFASGAEEAEDVELSTTSATGLRVPSTLGDRLALTAVRESDGIALAIPEAEAASVQRVIGQRGMGTVSLEGAIGFAAAATLADQRWLSPSERVVVIDWGRLGAADPLPDIYPPVEVDLALAEDHDGLVAFLAGGTTPSASISSVVLRGRAQTAKTPGPTSSSAEDDSATGAPAPSGSAGVEPQPSRAGSILEGLRARQAARLAGDPGEYPRPAPDDVTGVSAPGPSTEADGALTGAVVPGAADAVVVTRPRVPGEAVGQVEDRPLPRVPGEAGAPTIPGASADAGQRVVDRRPPARRIPQPRAGTTPVLSVGRTPGATVTPAITTPVQAPATAPAEPRVEAPAAAAPVEAPVAAAPVPPAAAAPMAAPAPPAATMPEPTTPAVPAPASTSASALTSSQADITTELAVEAPATAVPAPSPGPLPPPAERRAEAEPAAPATVPPPVLPEPAPGSPPPAEAALAPLPTPPYREIVVGPLPVPPPRG